MGEVIVDTGPLVALLVRTEDHHRWAVDRLRELTRLSDLRARARGSRASRATHAPRRRALRRLLVSDLLRVDFAVMAERATLGRLLRKYADRPMSLADACLVRLAELHDSAVVLTIDEDFCVYRKRGRREIPVIAPGGLIAGRTLCALLHVAQLAELRA